MSGYDEDINKVLARNVRRLRKERGLSQEQLANISGLARTYISALERNERNISLRNLQKLAIALRVSEAELVIRSND